MVCYKKFIDTPVIYKYFLTVVKQQTLSEVKNSFEANRPSSNDIMNNRPFGDPLNLWNRCFRHNISARLWNNNINDSSSSSTSSSFCDIYVGKETKDKLKHDFQYLQEYLDGNESQEDNKSEEQPLHDDDQFEIVFVGPPTKMNALGHYYCWATYRSNTLTSPLANIMLIKFDPHNKWAVNEIKLDIKIDSNVKIFWKETSHYLIVNNEAESKIYFYNKERHRLAATNKKRFDYEINMDNKNNNPCIKQCTDSEISSTFDDFIHKLFFIDLPENEQIFTTTEGSPVIKCNKNIWDFQYNSTEHILTKRDLNLYKHVFKKRISRLHESRNFCTIQDKMNGIWYQIYYDPRKRAKYRSILIIQLIDKDYMEINKFHIATTKIDMIIHNGILFFLSAKSEYILLFSLIKPRLLGKCKTDIFRPRTSTYLVMNTRIFDSYYISRFAALPNIKLPLEISCMIDHYVGNEHWKHEISIFPRFVLIQNEQQYDQNPVVVNLLRIMESLEFLCLID